jgi:outer membrane lipoprotein SlyB
MPFIYYGQGVASLYQDFSERLMSHLALKGTEITHQVLNPASAQMDVKHTGETGKLNFAIEGQNVKVVYTVDREHKEISKGVMGAVTGAGLGGILGSVLRRDQGGIGDAVAGVLGGAAAGGAYGAYDGYQESREDRTNFAAVLAETVKEVEDELQSILQGQESAREATREKAREKLEEETQISEEYRALLEELYGQILAIQEELEVAKSEGAKIEKSKARFDRAEKLFQEAQAAFDKKEYMSIKPKVTAAQSMVDKARELMAGNGSSG